MSWRRDAWLDAFPDRARVLAELPPTLDRATVKRTVEALPDSEEGVTAAFFVVMAWGFGRVPYGPSRVRRMFLPGNPPVPARLLEATRALRSGGAIAGYTALAGHARVKGLGPAFGAKYLFFQSPVESTALVLDRLVSDWIADNCGLRLSATEWSVGTYRRYMERMLAWAEACGLEPDTLEMVLFTEAATEDGGQWRSAGLPAGRSETAAETGDLPTVSNSSVARAGDPEEFDEELSGDVRSPDDPGEIQVPAGLLQQLLNDPSSAPELLATSAVRHHSERAKRDVRLLRERNPGVTNRQLAVHLKRKHSRAARWEGASTGAVGIVGLPADLALLAWIQSRLVLSIAAVYGHDMGDHLERATDLLIIQGIHSSRDVARRALVRATEKALRKLILRHLRKNPLVVVKQLFRVVGITFTRKALLEKGIPLVAVPLSAGVNEVSTRLLANQSIRYYDTDVDA